MRMGEVSSKLLESGKRPTETLSKELTMEEEFEERLRRLERREYADRCAIVALTGILAMSTNDDRVNEALISWGGKLPDEDDAGFPGADEEAKELFVTLATVAESMRNQIIGRPEHGD